MSGARGGRKSRLALAAAGVAVAAVAALPAVVLPTGAAAESAPIQYELALPSGNGKQGAEPTARLGSGVGDQGSERPASAAIGAIDDGTVILLLALILLLTALILGLGFGLRRQRLRRPRLTAVVAVAGLSLTAFLLAVLPAGGSSQRRPTVPRTYYGMIPQLPEPASEYKRMKANGVDSVRFGIAWNQVEPSKGHYDFSSVDQSVSLIAGAGMEPFPFLGATPDFYASKPCPSFGCFTSLPAQNAEQLNAWKAVVRALIRRYGSHGSFWAQNPGVPKRPFRVLQAWNEVNFAFFTTPRSPTLYGKLVKATHQAVRGVDRSVDVVLSGLFMHPKAKYGTQGSAFLNRLYRVKGIKGAFEGVALHPYAEDASDLKPDINRVRRIMKRHGDGRADLYMTELGWGSARDTAFEKGPAGQVRELTQAFTLLRNMQRSANIKRIFWFAWEDDSNPNACNFCDSVGLVTSNGSAKPSLARYSAFAHNKR